jgi:hypothetical protein
MRRWSSRTSAVLALCAAVASVVSAGAAAQAPQRPRPFLFQWISSLDASCSKLGAQWRQSFAKAFELAKARKEGFLPAALWDLSNPAYQSIPPAWDLDGRQCQEFVAYYSDPGLRSRLRGDTVKSLASVQVYKCMLWFPGLEKELGQAWTAAFARNGLPLASAEVDQGLAEWRLRGDGPRPAGDNQYQECRKLMGFLDREFDAAFSEERIRAYLLEDLNKDPNLR